MATNPGSELAALDFGNLIGGPLVAVITAQSLAADATTRFIRDNGFYPAGTKDPLDSSKDIGGTPIYVDFKYPKETAPYQPKVDAVAYVEPVAAIGDPLYPKGMQKPDGTAPTGVTLADAALNDAPNPDGLPVGAPGFPNGMKKLNGTAPTGVDVTLAAENNTPHPNGLQIYVPAVIGVPQVVGKPAVPAVYQDMKISVPILTMLPIPFIKVDVITIDFNAKITSTETATSSSDLAVSGAVNASYGGKRAYVAFSGSVAYKKSTTSGSSVERTYSMAIHVQASQDEMPAGMEKLLNLLEGAMKSVPVLPAPTTP